MFEPGLKSSFTDQEVNSEGLSSKSEGPNGVIHETLYNHLRLLSENKITPSDNLGNLHVDFERLLQLEEHAKKEAEKYSFDDCSEKLHHIEKMVSPEEIDRLAQEIVAQVKNKTNILHDVEKIDELSASIGLEIHHDASSPNQKTRWLGAYDLSSGSVYTTTAVVNSMEVIECWSLFGKPTASDAILTHEKTHALQFGKGRAKKIDLSEIENIFEGRDMIEDAKGRLSEAELDRIRLDLIIKAIRLLIKAIPNLLEVAKRNNIISLSESHAFQEGHLDDELEEHGVYGDLFVILQEDYGVESVDEVILAVLQMSRLLALDTPKEVLLGLIHSEKWNKRKADFPKIRKYIDDRSRELNLTEDDLDNLVIATRLESSIQKYRAMSIARDLVMNYRISGKG